MLNRAMALRFRAKLSMIVARLRRSRSFPLGVKVEMIGMVNEELQRSGARSSLRESAHRELARELKSRAAK
jgi:hypothetical protein